MATSGSFNTTGYDGRYLTFSWEVKSQSVADNTTTITWYLRGAGDTTTHWYYTQNIRVTIDGVEVFNKPRSDGQIQLRNGTVVTTGTYTFKHDDAGNRNFSAYAEAGIYQWAVNCTGSGSFSLPQIARASSIGSAADIVLGTNCSVKWVPLSAAFRYKLSFQLGNWKYTTGVIHPNKTTEYAYTTYAIPLDVANQIPSNPWGTMSVYLYTYSDSAGTAQVGNAAPATFKVTVPDNASTKPAVSMTLSPDSALPSKFAGLYIQGVTKVKATLSASGKYGATIKSYLMKVDGTSYGPDKSYTSNYLTIAGNKTVSGYATDVREYTGENQQTINVIPYNNPKLEGASAVRCDINGKETDSGTYLKIKAKRSYSPVVSNGVQYNFCTIKYRYSQNGTTWSQWATILDPASLSSDEVVTSPLLNGGLSVQLSYVVQVMAIDDVGRYAEAYITISTDKVYWHRDGKKNALGLGKYAEKENAIDSAWDIHMNNHKVTGLPTPVNATDAVPLGYIGDNIVDQGVVGNWIYRKWAGGLAELWGACTPAYVNTNVLFTELHYPFAMTSARCGISTLNSYGGNAFNTLQWNVKLAYGLDACIVWVHNQYGGFATSSTVDVSIYIVGRWK